MANRTEVLVSFRNFDEAEVVINETIDVFDLKEPLNGALGCPHLEAVEDFHHGFRTLAESRGERIPNRKLSVAIGELYSGSLCRKAETAAWQRALSNYDYVKIGLAGANRYSKWEEEWVKLASQFSPGTQLVPVAYADAKYCDAPSLQQVFEFAREQKQRDRNSEPYTMLIDTHDKTRGDLFGSLTHDHLASFISESKKYGLRVVVAGSVSLRNLESVLNCGAELVGVRGAVCRHGERKQGIDARLVRNFLTSVNCFSEDKFCL